MKTKFLLLWLMLLCISGLKAETILRLTLTDVPEGLAVDQLSPHIHFIIQDEWGGGYEKGYDLSHEEGTNSYVLYAAEYPELEKQNLTEGTLIIYGFHLIPPSPIIWKMTDGQKEQHLEYSLKDFQRYTLLPEEGWMLWEKKDEQTAFLPNIDLGYRYDEGEKIWGYTGENTVPINEAEYHIYALPGSYLWQGTLYKNDGNKKVRTIEEPVVFESGKPEVTLNVDWTNRTEVTPKVTGIEEDLSKYSLTLQNEKIWISTDIKSTLLLHRGENYQWSLEHAFSESPLFYVFSRKGSFIPDGNQAELLIDFSDYTRTLIDFTNDRSNLHAQDTLLEIKGEDMYEGIYMNTSSFPIYLPKNKTFDIAYSFTLTGDNSQEWSVYPLIQKVTTDQDKQISIRTSDFHKVSFIYNNQPFNSQISLQEYPDMWMWKKYASEIYMPNGDYHAEAYHPETWINMTCDFTIDGKDRIIDYETMADNCKTITVSVKNADLIPADIEAPYADLTFTKGEYGETFNLSVDLKEGSNTIFLPKATYTCQMDMKSSKDQILSMSISKSFELNGDFQELVFDLDTFHIVPLRVKDENGNLLPSFYSTLNNNTELLKKQNAPSYIITRPWRYQLSIFGAGYEAWEKMIIVSPNISEINVDLKKAEIFPIFIIPEDLKDGETATIQVEGIGTYNFSNENGFSGNLLRFMEVAAGTYNVTVSADGYETVQGQIMVDRSLCPEGCSEIIYKFSMENGFTGVQSADAVETLDIRSEGTQIVIDSETDCRAQIYTLSGVCMAHLQGKNMRSETLNPGVYLVLAHNTQGTLTKKIIIGH